MSIDTNLEDLVRRVVREELASQYGDLLERLRPLLGSPRAVATSQDGGEVNTKEAAALAHVKPRTISEWRRQGLLTPTKRGRSHVFRARDVLAVARNRGTGPKKIIDYDAEAWRILNGKAS